MTELARRRTASVLVVLASIAIALTLLVGYGERAVINSDQFANRATSVLRNNDVREIIATRVTDDVVLRHASYLTAARPAIKAAVRGVVASRALTGMLQLGVEHLHRALVSGTKPKLVVKLAEIGAAVAAGLDATRPQLADRVRDSGPVKLVQGRVAPAAAKLAHVAAKVRAFGWLLLALAVLLACAALWAATDRRRGIMRLGIGAIVGGAVIVVLYGVARGVVIEHFKTADAKTVAGVVFAAFAGGLQTSAWVLAGAGAVVAAAASSLVEPADAGAPLRRLGLRFTAARPSTGLLAFTGAVMLAACAALIFEFTVTIDLALTLIGVALVYAAVRTLLTRVTNAPAPETKPVRGHHSLRAMITTHRRPLVATAAAALLVVGGVLTFVGTGGVSVAAESAGGCDGSPALCDRPLNKVALAATHNSMAAPLPGWFAIEQDHPIARQLQDGIRGLLIDTYYADRLPDGRLRTEGGKIPQLRKEAAARGLDPYLIDTALQIRDHLGFAGGGQRGLYLCHGFCELGGTALGSVLDDLHDFLVANPNQVIVVVNEDYVKPSAFVSAVDAAGLGNLVYRGSVSGKWPTLRRMIAANQRVVFFAENRSGGADWYRPAYKTAINETPYLFTRSSQLTDPNQQAASCRANRGPETAPLFLINNWVSTTPVPLPSSAANVNAYKPLLARLRECERVRHHFPNLVAVNFYGRGDLFKVVDTLNGVGGRSGKMSNRRAAPTTGTVRPS